MGFVEQITRNNAGSASSGRYVGVTLADHALYDPEVIVENARLVVDTRNLVRELNGNGHKLVRRDGH